MTNKKNNDVNNNKKICPYCGGGHINKNGNKYSKQRYICRDCKKSFSDSDNRIKRNVILKELALLLYSSNVSIRSIQRTLNIMYNTNISISLIPKWIKSSAKLLEFKNKEEQKNKLNGSNNKQTINILEMDELWTYYMDKDKETGKNVKKNSKYGLLLTETEIKLLHLI